MRRFSSHSSWASRLSLSTCTLKLQRRTFALYSTLLDKVHPGEPIAYIRGFQEFKGHNFLVDRRGAGSRPRPSMLWTPRFAFDRNVGGFALWATSAAARGQ